VPLNSKDYQVLTSLKFVPMTRQIKVDTHLTCVGDALLEIFFHLDAEELWKCEKVCVDWKNVISCETLWKKILLQKVKRNSN
jgi:F-box-like